MKYIRENSLGHEIFSRKKCMYLFFIFRNFLIRLFTTFLRLFKLCTRNGRIKVRDHCHDTGVFRGASHQSCNVRYNNKPSTLKMPFFFHNLQGYDEHLLIRALKKRHAKIRIIPTNIEKFLVIQIGRVMFLDSFQFTLAGLDSLVTTDATRRFCSAEKRIWSG